MKFAWKSIFPSCYKGDDEYSSPAKTATVVATRGGSANRISMSDLSFPSATAITEDLSISLAGSNLHVFSLAELKIITQSFSSSNFLGEGGFGPVHKGFIDDKLRPGLQAQPVAVKLLDLDGTQGHKEWLTEVVFLGQLTHTHLVKLIGYCCEEEHRLLVYEYLPRGSLENQLFRRYSASLPWSTRMKIAVGAAKGLAFLHEAKKPVIYRDFKASNILLDSEYNAKLSDFGLAKDGPEGDETHVSTRVMGTQGYAAPEYIMTGHLTAMSDVYSFGVVLLEMLTGRRSVDKARPAREQNLVEWARPVLNDSRKLSRIMDPRLEGQYSEMGAKKAATLAYQCLSHRPRNRPTMTIVVKTLEPLQDFDDIPIGPFVYTVPADNSEVQQKDAKEGEITTPKERKRENGSYHRNQNLSNGRRHSSDSVEGPRENARECDTPKERKRESGHRNHQHRRKHPLKSPDSRSQSRHEAHQNGKRSGSHSPDEPAAAIVAAAQNEVRQNGKRSGSHSPDESASAVVAATQNEVHQNGRRSGSQSPESGTAIVAAAQDEVHQNGKRSGSHSPESTPTIVAATRNERHQNSRRTRSGESTTSIVATTQNEVHQNDRISGSHSPESATATMAAARIEVHQNGSRHGPHSPESANAVVAVA